MFRSAVFAISLYLNTALLGLLGCWMLVLPRHWGMALFRTHSRSTLWLLRRIVGTVSEVRGIENLPPGPVLVAAKHQSAWDTISLPLLLRDPAMVMKQELIWIPIYGWFSRKIRMIFVHRKAGPAALRRMARDAADRASAGREIVIFPEGTRRAPGAPPDYKSGVILLYEALGVPCCPVALNSGLFWPRRSLRRYPGRILVEVLEPIPPGLPRDQFMTRLQDAIESASDRLLREAGEARTPPPTWQAAMDRLRQRPEP